MKALSGYAEWFWLLAVNIKDVENRSWPIPRTMALPAKILLHASKTKTPYCEMELIEEELTVEQLKQFKSVNFNDLRGKIIGEITITKQVEGDNLAFPELNWYWGPFGFLVKDGILWPEPIPWRGSLGFFEVDRGDLIEAAVKHGIKYALTTK
jgi:hypothetical protein